MNDTRIAALERALHADMFVRYPAEAAELIETMNPEAVADAFDGHEAQTLVPVFETLSPASWQRIAGRMPPALVSAILNKVPATRAAMLLRVLDEPARAPLIQNLEHNQKADVELVLGCAPDSAGAVMDPRVIFLRRNLKVGEALARLRQGRHHRQHARARRIMFVVTDEGRLEGIVAIQDLALADPDDPISVYMQPAPAVVSMNATKDEIIDALSDHTLSSLPVVDADGHLAGVVRYEELVTAAKEDATADLQAMFGASRDEKALSKSTFAIKKRLPWLQINLLTAFLAASVVGVFENTIASYTALAVLLPVVAGQSGNTGAQALAVVIRGLALREISIAHWRRVLIKESLVGAVNGVAVAATTSLGVYFWSGSKGLTMVIALSMVISMAIASMAGASIPIILTRLGQDPAQSSSIVLTTVTDVAGFFSFLGIATIFIATL